MALRLSLGAYLATALAHVRLLSRVNTLVYSQRRPLDELLAAVGEVADVGADAGVNALYFTVRQQLLRYEQ